MILYENRSMAHGFWLQCLMLSAICYTPIFEEDLDGVCYNVSLRPHSHSKRKNVLDIDPLFTSLSRRNKGGRLATLSIRRIVKNYLRKIGLNSKRYSAHSLRHTATNLSLKAGATLQEAQMLARHASITTTLIYAHNLDRIFNTPEKKIDDLHSNK